MFLVRKQINWEERTIIDRLIDIIYPKTCPVCGRVRPYGKKDVCESCVKGLKWVESPVCMKCGKTLEDEEAEFCADCIRIPKSFDRNYPVFDYEGEIKDSLYAFKYKNQRDHADFYAGCIVKRYGSQLKEKGFDGIVPVPVHKKKKKSRGYNQAELIALSLGELLDITVYPDYLVRTEATDPQKELDDKERMKNLKNAFNIGQNDVKLEKILLVDDIYTSGATMDACTRVLLASGVISISCVSVAIGRGY